MQALRVHMEIESENAEAMSDVQKLPLELREDIPEWRREMSIRLRRHREIYLRKLSDALAEDFE